MTLSGPISGPGGLSLTDAGALILSAANTYSGGTTVNAGTLVVANSSGDLVIGSSGHCTNDGDMSNIGNFTNAGIFAGNAQVSGSFSNSPTGTVRIAPGESLYVQGASSQSNAGLIQLIGTASAQAQLESAGPLSNAAGTGLITGQNATVNFDSGLTNRGSVAFSYGISNVSVRSPTRPAATLPSQAVPA